MKKIATMMMAACAVAFAAFADEEIAMVEKEITSITVPFGIRSYTPSNKDVVRIEKTSDNALRITALKSGRCDLEVRGDMDMTQKFQISVGGDLPRTLATLRRELERMPEVHADIVGNSIRIDGEVKTVKKWNYLMKVIKGYPSIRNFAEFTPGDDLLKKMKEALQQSGFTVVFLKEPQSGEPDTWKANNVVLSYSQVNRTMTIQARVYTPEQQAKIMECLKNEKRWLHLDGASAPAADDEYLVRANVQVVVAKPLIRISVAYMAIQEEDLKDIGNARALEDGAMGLSGTFDTLYSLIPGRSTPNGTPRHGVNTARVGANIGVFTRFLAQNKIGRVSDTGYTLMESWSKDGAKFKTGGTLFVPVAGADSADLKEVPYGFIINTKGGMAGEDVVDLNLEFEVSAVEPGIMGSINRKEDISKQKVSCPIGRTTLVGGIKRLVDDNMPPSGLPFLRSTPILNWFVADSGKSVNDRRLLIMICPEIVDNTQDAKPDVDNEINIRVQDQAGKDTDQVLKEREEASGNTGFWSWLNWFKF